MKTKFLQSIIMFVLLGGIILINLAEIDNAKTAIGEITFVEEPTYQLINTVIKNDVAIGWTYEIIIKLENTGDIKSQELKINLSDMEGFILENTTYINPSETKIITFLWSTLINKNQQLSISYYPADIDADWNQYNSGKTNLIIEIPQDEGIPNTSTPGFELIILIFSITVIIGYKLIKTKK